MEMHHKLRRDPNWHPSACNICGQLGHQAAQCTNGTINWRQLYGDEAFRLKEPLYESELQRMRQTKAVDISALEKRAKEYAAMRSNAADMNMAVVGEQVQGMALDAAASGAPVKEEAKPAVAAASDPAQPLLPAGWAAAKDPQGRTYYWHTKTKKVTWEKPTAETPVE